MNITVASGKGGTGKTTLAVSLALALCGERKVQFVDADVEAPNAHLFLHPSLTGFKLVEKLLPQIDEARCERCGACARACQFHAIAQMGERLLVYPTLCHGCGRCRLVCPADAIVEIPQRLGVVETGTVGDLAFAQGRLDIGQAMATPIIQALTDEIDPEVTTIIDAPPGTGCPAVAALGAGDVALLVTEPTPFGLHDLRCAVGVVQTLERPMGVVINRDGIGDDGVERFCAEKGIPILMRIGFDRRIAAAYASGTPLYDLEPDWKGRFLALFAALKEMTS